MQIVHHLPVKNRRPMISLHVVSGPWTSIVAALDKGRFIIAVCRRYTTKPLILNTERSACLLFALLLSGIRGVQLLLVSNGKQIPPNGLSHGPNN